MNANGMTGIPTLTDRYELEEALGEGAIGTVYRAWDRDLGIPVAVKIMHARLTRNTELLRRFADEASLSTRMLSPHVVKVLGLAVTEDDAPCIVYEHLVGETLAARLARVGCMSVAETADVVSQVGRALSRAHAVGVLHRDVKPDNIFLVDQPGGRTLVKLLDFGVAETMDIQGEGSDVIVGTAEYISPEVLFGTARATTRTDVYALGVVAFECLTGACPFPGDHIDDILLGVARGERTSFSVARRDVGCAVHAELEAFFDRAVAAEPADRFASAREMSEALQQIARRRHVDVRQAA